MMATLLLAALLPAVAGCFFEPRDPEPPASGTPVVYLPRGEAENVVANAEIALNARDAAGWDDAIGENFAYHPDDQTSNVDYPDVDWDNWDRSREMAFVASFFASVNQVQMDLNQTVQSVEELGGGAELWTLVYFMTVTTSQGTQTKYSGRAELTLRLIGSYWFIDDWRDLEGETDPDTGGLLATMGSVRGAFGSK